MAATAVTLNDLEGHSPVAGLFKCNASNICAAFYTISSDSVLARSRWASYMNRETIQSGEQFMVETRKVDINKIRKALFVNLCPLDI